MATNYAVEVEGLHKWFRIYPGPFQRIVEGLSLGRIKGHREFSALRDINFKLKPGSSIGLCGANGAGKSTLLKILAGTTSPSAGRYRINGKVSSLLELGAGFHSDFTGRANIMMNGIMMGASKEEMERLTPEIIDFAELGDYIDEPVRTYSSGMGLRLGFSVAMAVDPDVMLIDEVFAVGDMYFQKKCVDKIYELKKRNKTIAFCSHSLYDVRQLCDEALWLRDGDPAALGDSVSVTNEYTVWQRNHIDEEAEHLSESEAGAVSKRREELSNAPEVLDARVYHPQSGEERYEYQTGDDMEIRVWWRNPKPEQNPINLAVGFVYPDMTTVAGMLTHIDGFKLEGSEGCTSVHCSKLNLLSNQFLVAVILFDGEGTHQYQKYLIRENLSIRHGTKDVGMVLVDHHWNNRPEIALPTGSGARIREANVDGTQGHSSGEDGGW